MGENDDLKAKLDALGAQISDAREQLKLRDGLDYGHQATGNELQERYEMLSRQLDEEVANRQSHDEHVGSLEKTVLNWVNSLGFN